MIIEDGTRDGIDAGDKVKGGFPGGIHPKKDGAVFGSRETEVWGEAVGIRGRKRAQNLSGSGVDFDDVAGVDLHTEKSGAGWGSDSQEKYRKDSQAAGTGHKVYISIVAIISACRLFWRS